MNTKQFLEKLTNNWLAKVVCFIIAIFLYFFNQISTLDKKTFIVPLTVINKGELINSTSLNKNKFVKIRVRGKSEQIATLSEKDFKAYIDVSNVTQSGTYDFNVNIEEDERVSALEPLELTCKPDKLTLTLEDKVMRMVKVTPTIAGELPYGYEQVKVEVDPQYIQIVGAKSVVDNVKSLQTNAVFVNEATEDFTKTVKAYSNNELINFDKSQEFNVTVFVAPQDTVRTFDNVAINFVNLPENFEVKYEGSPIQIKTEGTVVALEKLNSEDVKVSVNLADVTAAGEYEADVSVKIPAGIKLAYLSDEKIKVVITEKPVPAETQEVTEEKTEETQENNQKE